MLLPDQRVDEDHRFGAVYPAEKTPPRPQPGATTLPIRSPVRHVADCVGGGCGKAAGLYRLLGVSASAKPARRR